MNYSNLSFKLLSLFFLFSIIISCDSSKKFDKEKKVETPDYHKGFETHTHSPCSRVANTSSSSKNIKAKVRSKNNHLFDEKLIMAITPPDCRTGGVIIEPKESYKVRVVGFTMLQKENGIWVTTPPEYVAFAPKEF